nr:hypothetical protein [Cherry necrotic rusty mottle virus]
MRMEPSSEMLQVKRSQRRRRLGRPLMINVRKLTPQGRVTSTSLEQEGEGLSLTPKIPLPVLAESLSAEFRKRTQLRSTLLLMTQLRQLPPTGSSTLRSQMLRSLIAYSMLSGTVTTTVQVTKPNSWGDPSAMLSSRNWRVLLGATVLYVAFAQNTHQ